MDLIRVAVLVCCCLLTFGSYFSYDLPGALTDDFRTTLAQNNTAHQGLFYSFYSLPNTIQPFFGGIIIDKFLGLRYGSTICCALVAVGCAIVALAASISSWQGTSTAFMLAITGRFVFGLGGETLSVCQNAYCAKWFRGADLSTAFAIVLSFARVGSAVNFAIEPKVSDNYGFSSALWLSALLCFVSLGACVVLAFVDLRFESMTDLNAGEGDTLFDGDDGIEEEEDGFGRVGSDLEESLLRSENRRRNSEGGVAELMDTPSSQQESRGETQKSKGSTLEILKAVLGPREILIYLICVQFYIAVFIFIAVASKFLVDTYADVDKIQAGLLTSLPYTVSAIVSPLLGLTMDKVGRGGLLVGLACLSLFGVHCTFAFFAHQVSPTLVMVWLGLTYSACAASLWPMIALVVESRNISTAYGLMMSIQNTGLCLAPMVIMRMVPSSLAEYDNYKTIEVIFAGFAFGALLCTVLLYFVDRRLGGVLFAPPSETGLLMQPSPRINPLNPRATPFIQQRAFRPSVEARQAIAPKTPQAIRQQYFRRLRIQSHI